MGKVVLVEAVQILRLSDTLLYSAPFEEKDVLCFSCGERKPRDPCPHCGYPHRSLYVNGGAQCQSPTR